MVDHRFAKSVLFVHSSLDDAGLTANEFRVYCHLARRAGNTGDAFPSVQTVADVCRMNRDTVWAALKSLAARGMLQRVPRPGLSTMYVLTTPEHWNPAENRGWDPAESEGYPSDSPSGNEGVGGSGNEGVGPSGKEGVRRYSTEGNPLKSIPKQRVREASGRMSADEWTPLQEHRDLAAVRNADIDAQLSRFRERNAGQTDTDQWWSVRFRQWLGSSKPERSVSRESRESLARVRETLDHEHGAWSMEHGAWSMEHGAGSMEIQPPIVPREQKSPPTEQEVIDHCKAKHPDWHESGVIDLYRHYVATDWTDKDGKPIKNWKNKFSVIYGFKKQKGQTGPTEDFIRKSRESQNSNPDHRMYMQMKVERDYAE